MNSKEQDFDWHEKGVYLMHAPSGEPVVESAADNAYSCRAEFLRTAHRPWSKLVEDGYYVQRYTAS